MKSSVKEIVKPTLERIVSEWNGIQNDALEIEEVSYKFAGAIDYHLCIDMCADTASCAFLDYISGLRAALGISWFITISKPDRLMVDIF